MVKIQVNLFDEFSYDLLNYLSKFSKNLQFDRFKKNKHNKDEVVLTASFGNFDFTFNSIIFNCEYQHKGKVVSTNHGPDYYKYIIIECKYHNNKDKDSEEIKKFFLEIKEDIRPALEKEIRVCIPNNGRWDILSTIPKRERTTIFLDNLDEIINDINNFMKAEDEYKIRGVKYKRNYLLHGHPGTGKTSIITLIASIYDLDVFMMNLSNNLTDTVFMKLISKLPKRSLLVLEDIDCLFTPNDGPSNLSFSAILNTLDGFACKNRMITFMTTNYIEKLDSALIRPGRIDCIYEFKYATKTQIQNMFNSYFPSNNSFKSLYKKIKNKKITTAALQKFFFENRNNRDIISKLDLLNNLTEQYKSYNNMYT